MLFTSQRAFITIDLRFYCLLHIHVVKIYFVVESQDAFQLAVSPYGAPLELWYLRSTYIQHPEIIHT